MFLVRHDNGSGLVDVVFAETGRVQLDLGGPSSAANFCELERKCYSIDPRGKEAQTDQSKRDKKNTHTHTHTKDIITSTLDAREVVHRAGHQSGLALEISRRDTRRDVPGREVGVQETNSNK